MGAPTVFKGFDFTVFKTTERNLLIFLPQNFQNPTIALTPMNL